MWYEAENIKNQIQGNRSKVILKQILIFTTNETKT